MSTFMYDKGRENFAKGQVDWTTGDIRLVFVDTTLYTVNAATDATLADIAAGARVATSAAGLTSPTATLGVMDAADHTINSVSGAQFAAIVVIKYDSVTPDNSLLLFYIDNYSGLPATPNGGNITVAFPNDTNKICKL